MQYMEAKSIPIVYIYIYHKNNRKKKIIMSREHLYFERI